MIPTLDQRTEFNAEYTKLLSEAQDHLEKFRDVIVTDTLVISDVNYVTDFKEFARHSLIFKMRLILEEFEANESIMNQVIGLIDNKYQ